VRQYDSDGTAKLLAFFGPICFEFTLEQAIGVCLVPYDYYVHSVDLTVDEMDVYKDLTEQISRLSWKLEQGIKDAQLDSLLRKRRLVVETAAGKLGQLGSLLDAIGARNLRHELIYATDKNPDQLNAVNAMLSARGVLFHQLTAEETGNRRMTSDILSGYQSGALQALTAKRVLDEGVNIPQIRRAFILASTTVERQWVQRRGRILRRCDAIGKDHGIIHDFVALPPKDMLSDPDARHLVRGELKRVEEFAAAARNYAAPDGPLATLVAMQSVVHGI
jgi:superfamily II DNA or RNA helicase